MTINKRVRLHRFHDTVAISFDTTATIYIHPQDARALATELTRFADNCESGNPSWVATRLVQDGQAISEATGKTEVHMIH